MLTAADRAALADYWSRAALMEHASVAAFARFLLDLLALGAPPNFLVQAQEALADETEHARMAFSLASAYAQAPIGPGPLDIDGALFDGPLAERQRHFFETLMREGCLGETLAAAEATAALAYTKDPAVRAVLARIARDETRHAELAWSVARWLFDAGDSDFRQWVVSGVARWCVPPEGPAQGWAVGRDEHGCLDPATRELVARDTVQDIVRPFAAALFHIPAAA